MNLSGIIYTTASVNSEKVPGSPLKSRWDSGPKTR